VHLHLEHPLVQRLLNRFLARGFQGEELSRAAVIATHDDTAKLILLARLSLYGHGAARLHDEVLELVAEWDPADPSRRLRVLNATKSDLALADLETNLRERLPAVEDAIQRQLRGQLPADVAQLKDRLEALAAERAERAKAQLGKRAEDEANAFVKVLQEQRERIPQDPHQARQRVRAAGLWLCRPRAAPTAQQPFLLGQTAGADRAGSGAGAGRHPAHL
jgi:hypothetical protein